MGLFSVDTQDLVDSVDAFNNASMDKTQTMFRECLGTEFPFDIIDAVQRYVNSLSNLLNANLDDLLCGSAISNANNAFNNVIDTTKSSVSSVEKTYDDFFGDGQEDAAKDAVKNSLIDNVIVSNKWLRSFGSYEFEHTSNSGDLKETNAQHIYTKKFSTSMFGDSYEDLNAEEVNISIYTTLGYFNWKNVDGVLKNDLFYSFGIEVDVVDLQRGEEPDLFEDNPVPPQSGHFARKFILDKVITKDQRYGTFDLGVQTIQFSANKDITLSINPVVMLNGDYLDNCVPSFSVTLGPLKYNKAWSSISKNDSVSDAPFSGSSMLSEAKKSAQNALKAQFMSSSVVDDIVDESLENIGEACPALAGLKSNEVSSAIKHTIADNAINLINGDPIGIDNAVRDTLISTATASAVNHGLEKLGIDAEISADCTKQLLGDLLALLPDATFDNPFAGLFDGVGIPAWADGILSKLKNLWDKLLNADCLNAINDAYDICDMRLSNATGNALQSIW